MRTGPLVSVVIPTYRRPVRLARALASVARQTYKSIEILVINDGGPSVEHVVERFRANSGCSVHYLALPTNRGLATVRNFGIGVANGDIIALLDDDDCYCRNHVRRLVDELVSHPSAVLAYDEVLIELEDVLDFDGEPHITAICRFGLAYNEQGFDESDFIVPSSIAFRHRDFDAAGRFDEDLPICEDWDFLLRLRRLGTFNYMGPGIGVEYSLRPLTTGNMSSTFDEQRQRTLDTLSNRYGLPKLGPKTFRDVAEGLGFHFTPFVEGSLILDE